MSASSRSGAWFVVLASIVGCGKSSAPPPSAVGAAGVGLASVDDVGRALDEAMALGASTWPGAELSGVRVGPAVALQAGVDPRTLRNVYTARVSFVTPAAAPPAGSVDCAPGCRTVPAGKLRASSAPPLPCAFPDALAAARRAGLTATQPVITFGSWSEQDRTGWVFQADPDAPPIEIDDGCSDAARRPAPPAPVNGAPMAFVVHSFTPGARAVGRVTIKGYNFADATLTTLGVAARFFDQAGAPLEVGVGTPFEKAVAWTTLGGPAIRCTSRSWCTFRLLGLEVPAATARVEVMLTSARAVAAGGDDAAAADFWKSPAGIAAWPE